MQFGSRALTLLLAAILVVSASALASQNRALNLNFQVPAQATGNVTATGQWAILVFNEESHGDFQFSATRTSAINHSRFETRTESDRVLTQRQPVPLDDKAVEVAEDLTGRLIVEHSWSMLLLEADTIRLETGPTKTTLHSSTGDDDWADFMAGEPHENPEMRLDDEAAKAGAVLTMVAVKEHGQIPLHVDLQGLHRIEWHNVTIECSTNPCPDGAQSWGIRAPIPRGYTSTRTQSFLDVHSADGALQGTGTVLDTVIIGQGMNWSLDGLARFPEATLSGDCGGIL